jgi:hypothetical protein
MVPAEEAQQLMAKNARETAAHSVHYYVPGPERSTGASHRPRAFQLMRTLALTHPVHDGLTLMDVIAFD